MRWGRTATWLFLLALGQVLWGGARAAAPGPVDAGRADGAPIGYALSWLQEKRPMTPEEAGEAFEAGRFTPSRQAVLDFGIGAPPVWLAFSVRNDSVAPLKRILAFKASWLDRIDVHFLSPDGTASVVRTGDAYPFHQRPLESRYFLLEHDFAPGKTRLLVRVETSDPMLLPIYLLTGSQANAGEVKEGYGYGLLYGGIVILIAYNFMLFLGLKSRRYLFYSIYLGAFLMMNMAYSGHGYQWLWPEWPTVQYWSNPVLILSFGLAGLLFALRFLELYRAFPRIHRAVLLLCVLFLFLGLLSIALQNRSMALILSFVSVLLLSLLMPLLGGISFFSGNRSAKYFLLGSLTHATGGSITALTVWGAIPYTPFFYHAVEGGMFIDAVLMALALADQYRILQEERLSAVQLARIDPLTGLYNRRAFYDTVKPLWNRGIRKGHQMAVMILDLDRFKQLNDTYGHQCGDEALKQVARLLVDNMRDGDVVARWGGEEFIAFFDETDREKAAQIANRIRSTIEERPFEMKNMVPLRLTASVGVTCFQGEETELDGLIDAADRCLYSAKEQGRNRVLVGDVNCCPV